LIEKIAEVDEEVMGLYLDERPIPEATLKSVIRRCTIDLEVVPVLCGAALKNKGIRWFAETDLSVAEDPELLKLMREAGCVQLLIGLESPEKASLHKLETKNDWKYKHFQKYKSAIRTIQSHGITVNGCFVLGLDGQTTDVFNQVFEFVKSTELYEVQATIMTPFPGTALYARLKNENRLIEADNWKKCTLFDINFLPAKMSVEDLDRNFKKLVGKLYSDEFTAWRRSNFKKNLRRQKF